MSTAMDRAAFRAAVATIVQKAKGVLPQEINGRLEGAVALVLQDDVWPQEDGSIQVGSSTDASKTYHLVGTTCECKDFTDGKAPEGWCRHRIAAALHKRVHAMLPDHDALSNLETPPLPVTPVEAPHGIDPRYVVLIRNKPFIRYGGLLQMAYAQGLIRLETTFISVSADVALAQCTATFEGGRVVTDVADSTPGNVGATVKLHWPRLAATRAAARALRNALAIDVTALEELAGHEMEEGT